MVIIVLHEISSLFMWAPWESTLGLQTWRQAPFPSKPCDQPLGMYSFFVRQPVTIVNQGNYVSQAGLGLGLTNVLSQPSRYNLYSSYLRRAHRDVVK